MFTNEDLGLTKNTKVLDDNIKESTIPQGDSIGTEEDINDLVVGIESNVVKLDKLLDTTNIALSNLDNSKVFIDSLDKGYELLELPTIGSEGLVPGYEASDNIIIKGIVKIYEGIKSMVKYIYRSVVGFFKAIFKFISGIADSIFGTGSSDDKAREQEDKIENILVDVASGIDIDLERLLGDEETKKYIEDELIKPRIATLNKKLKFFKGLSILTNGDYNVIFPSLEAMYDIFNPTDYMEYSNLLLNNYSATTKLIDKVAVLLNPLSIPKRTSSEYDIRISAIRALIPEVLSVFKNTHSDSDLNKLLSNPDTSSLLTTPTAGTSRVTLSEIINNSSRGTDALDKYIKDNLRKEVGSSYKVLAIGQKELVILKANKLEGANIKKVLDEINSLHLKDISLDHEDKDTTKRDANILLVLSILLKHSLDRVSYSVSKYPIKKAPTLSIPLDSADATTYNKSSIVIKNILANINNKDTEIKNIITSNKKSADDMVKSNTLTSKMLEKYSLTVINDIKKKRGLEIVIHGFGTDYHGYRDNTKAVGAIISKALNNLSTVNAKLLNKSAKDFGKGFSDILTTVESLKKMLNVIMDNDLDIATTVNNYIKTKKES